MNDLNTTQIITFCQVVIFHISKPSRRICVKLTKKGVANLRDVKRLINDGYGVPIKYTSYGWPKWSRYKGEDIPEEFPGSTKILTDFGFILTI